jgi:hypothetical protein
MQAFCHREDFERDDWELPEPDLRIRTTDTPFGTI